MATKKRGRRTPTKKSRRRSSSPKFVQIAAGSTTMRDEPRLYALDEAGGVWQKDFVRSVWIELALGRQPNPIHAEEM